MKSAPETSPPDGDSPAQATFKAHEEAFRILEAGAPPMFGRRFLLAGRLVWLRAAGEALGERLYAPFAHLPVAGDAGPAELVIQVIDASAFPAPPPAATAPGHFDREHTSGRHTVLVSADGRFFCHRIRQSGSVWCLDRKRALIVGATDSPEGLTLYEQGKPFQPLLPLWLSQGRRQFVHAGLVARGGQGVMFAGSSGSGKSTATLCCLAGGFDYLGDDYLVLEPSDNGAFVGHSVYSSAWLDPDHLGRFPQLAPHGIRGGYANDDKRLLLLAGSFRGRLPAAVGIRYLVLPRVRGNGQTALSKATRGEALRYLAPSCMLYSPRLGPEGFRVLAELVERVECRWLDLGSDLDAIAREVARLVG